MLNLSPRLMTIAELIENSSIMADIGTDHAYLPAYLIMSERCKHAVASDIRSGPLNRARDTVIKYGLSDMIELRLGAGLETISPGDHADTIVIAGMGGLVISNIISAAPDIVSSAKHIILQPMTMAPELRDYLYTNPPGEITEHLAFEGDKIYNIISIKTNAVPNPSPLTHAELFVGRSLIETRPEGFERYVKHLIQKLSCQISGLSHGETKDAAEKLKNTKILLSDVKNLI